MCGRFVLDSSIEELIHEFRATHNQFPEWVPRWNIAPTSHIPIVLEGPKGERSIAPARWSLIPPWSTELTVPYATFNARSETAGQKPTFCGPLEHTRCLIPASGITNGPRWERRSCRTLCIAPPFLSSRLPDYIPGGTPRAMKIQSLQRLFSRGQARVRFEPFMIGCQCLWRKRTGIPG